jgi:hypothetical protein
MRVSNEEVVTAFRDLMTGVRSREDIATWASRVRKADDAEGIEYVPPSAESAIWDALEFLMGVDLKDGPDSYLHNHQDFLDYWTAKKEYLVG